MGGEDDDENDMPEVGVMRTNAIPGSKRTTSFSKRTRFPKGPKKQHAIHNISPKDEAVIRRGWQLQHIAANVAALPTPSPKIRVGGLSAARKLSTCRAAYEWNKNKYHTGVTEHKQKLQQKKAKIIYEMGTQLQAKMFELQKANEEKHGWFGGGKKEKKIKAIEEQIEEMEGQKKAKLKEVEQEKATYLKEQDQLRAERNKDYTQKIEALKAEVAQIESKQNSFRSLSRIKFGDIPSEYQISPLACAPRKVIR